MKLEKSIEYALSGDAILFLGSGASVGAINQNDEPLPIGKELAHRIYSDCDDLTQAADFYCEDKDDEGKDGKQELISFLKQEFRVKKISDYQKMIPLIPWKRIYTTNYDDVVEKAYNIAGKYVRSLTTDNDPCDYISSDKTIYLHINGDINKLSKNSLNVQFKLTDYSYNTSSFKENQWGTLFNSDLKTYSVAIFIGFSMNYDLDIKRIISTVKKEKCIFIVHKDESQNTIRMLKKYGDVECIGIEGFFDKVSEIQKDFEFDADIEKMPYTNFERITNYPTIKEPNDNEVLTYYKVGKKTNSLYYEKNGNYKAIVKRNVVDDAVENIENGIECIFIHSDIGNGKTEAVDQICLQLSSKFSIFKLVDYNEKIALEIEDICKSTGKKIVVIENFFNYYDVFEKFQLFNSNNNITFIFTARTSIYKSRYESFLLDKTKVYDLNRLKEGEIKQLVNIFSEYGYYPKKKHFSSYYDWIKKQHKSKLQSIILEIFDNQSITNSLKNILLEIQKLDKKSRSLLTFMIVIKIMNLDLSFDDILELLDMNGIDYTFEKNDGISELVYFGSTNTSIKSVTVCMWILKNLKNTSNIFDVLVNAAIQADIGYKVNKKYENFLGNIISYKHLKFVLNLLVDNNNEKLKYINNFYQRLKNLNYYKDKYFFWLQYGISAIELKDFDSAEQHLNAALAKTHNEIIPFEINNQYARLKMELMLKNNYEYNSSTYAEIVEINKLLTPTKAKEDDEYYCYKMSSSYYPKLFSKFYSCMSEEEREGMKNIAENNNALCLKYLIENRNDNFVKSVMKFANVYENLSNYQNDHVEFSVESIIHNYAYGKAIIEGNKRSARIHISQISNNYVKSIQKYLPIGKTISCKVLKFNDKNKIWELSCKL